MGRVLFIRVSAETYDEKDVPKSWPALYAVVWPDPGLDGSDSPAKLARKLIPARERGVLELVDAFVDYAHFADMGKERRGAIRGVSDKLEQLRRELGEALGDRDVSKAHPLTGAIEDALDEAEKILRSAPA